MEEHILEKLSRRYPQLLLPLGFDTKNTPEDRGAVLRGEPCVGTLDFTLSPEDLFSSMETPAGPAEILSLDDRKDFEHCVRALAFRCEPREIPPSMGAVTVSGLINGKGCAGILTGMIGLLAAFGRYDVRLANTFLGPAKGCRAGIYNYSVNVDGLFSPCRHLDCFEKWNTLDEYLDNSPVIAKIREADQHRQEPCLSCQYNDFCRHCLAVNSKIHNDIYIGNEFCPLGE